MAQVVDQVRLQPAMAKAVTELTGVDINRDHKPGGSGTVGMTAYMAAPADGYNVLEHIDDASSAHALDSSKPNPGKDLDPPSYFASDILANLYSFKRGPATTIGSHL